MGIASRVFALNYSLPLRFSGPFCSRHVFQLDVPRRLVGERRTRGLGFLLRMVRQSAGKRRMAPLENVDPVNLKGKANLGE
jgi:hypothetical protein